MKKVYEIKTTALQLSNVNVRPFVLPFLPIHSPTNPPTIQQTTRLITKNKSKPTL